MRSSSPLAFFEVRPRFFCACSVVPTTARLSSLPLPYTFSAFLPASCFLILTFWGMSFSLSRKLHEVTSSRLNVRALSAVKTPSLR